MPPPAAVSPNLETISDSPYASPFLPVFDLLPYINESEQLRLMQNPSEVFAGASHDMSSRLFLHIRPSRIDG